MNKDELSELESIWDEARNHISSGKPDKAVEIYRYALVRYSDHPDVVEYANAYLGDLYLTLRQLDLAEKYIRKAINCAPETAAYHYILGFIFSHRRQWEQSIPEFETAVAGEPQKAEYLRGLGWAVFSQSDQKKGLQLLHQADKLSPNSVNILTDLSVAYLGLDLNKSVKYAEQAAATAPDSALAQKVLRNIQAAQEDINWITNNSHGGLEKGSYSFIVGIYQFKVSLKDNPNIWRIIEIQNNQRLSTLHKAILLAFNRPEDSSYSFFFKQERGNKKYEFAAAIPGISGTAKPAKSIRIDSIMLYHDEGQKMSYLFDYENMIWHEIELIQVTDKKPRGKYPRVVKKQGKLKK